MPPNASTGVLEELSPVKRALLEIRELRARLAESARVQHEPVAIVGMALRMPGGASTPQAFWDVLAGGVNTVTEVPPERWDIESFKDPDPSQQGKTTCRYGAFLDAVDMWDPEFFGMLPREADSTDPQQRILLELVWEALENAGIPPRSLSGSKTGVFLGISNSDYARRLIGVPEEIDQYSVVGGALSIAAGRISYFLGTHGPSISVDTACSAALVAIHLACQSVRSGECSMAIAAGFNLILSPEAHISFSKAGMMAADGRCKSFDAAADGYVRGEGGGVILLKRLSDAVAAQDRILAVVRGSAINQDGRSAGLTAPNGPAQEAVIREALANAQADPLDVSYVETHGTGTPLGDPIEVRALASTYGKGRASSDPLFIGSVKTNVGHLEAAAGMAGLFKLILSLEHQTIPPNLHFLHPNPHIEWSSIPLAIPTSPIVWNTRQPNAPRLAGLSSFGFSGTNCHLILEEAPPATVPVETDNAPKRAVHCLCLSAKTATRLRQMAEQYAAFLGQSRERFEDICHTASAGRSHHSHRLAVRAAGKEEAREKLRAWLDGGEPEGVACGSKIEFLPEVAFLFTGQGAQYANMGRGLYETSPVFRQAIDRCDEISRPLLAHSLLSILYSESGPDIDDTLWTQPALFAVEYALAVLWRSWGVEPSVLVGHSLGEFTAACIAGTLSLEDALAAVIRRGELMASVPPGGLMAAIAASEDEVAEVMRGVAVSHPGEIVGFAAINGPKDVVISGAAGLVREIADRCASVLNVQTKVLRISNAFHSPLVDPVLPEFERTLSAMRFLPPKIPFVSNLTGRIECEAIRSPRYWSRHMREPVQFGAGVETIAARGPHLFLEAGPHPALGTIIARGRPDLETLPSLRRDRDEWERIADTLNELFVRGVKVDWAAFDLPYARRRVALPTYPFERRSYWYPESRPGFASSAATIPAETVWRATLSAANAQCEWVPAGLDLDNHHERYEALLQLTIANIQNALLEIGAYRNPGDFYTAAGLIERFAVPPAHRRLVERWLRLLAGHGYLKEEGESFGSAAPLPQPNLEACWADVSRILARDQSVLRYLRNCGEKLAGVIQGRYSALETLFPEGSFDLAEGIYQNSLEGRYINRIAAAAVSAAAGALTPFREIRILEVGAGTGGTTSSLLPLLPPGRADYWFTDLSDLFLARAQSKFRGFPFVRYLRGDLEQPLDSQGIPERAFDVIVAANVIHATKNLAFTLGQLRKALAPGGIALLIETTRYDPIQDMSVGLIEGWGHFEDTARVGHPLLPPDRWTELFREAGFEVADRFPGEGSPGNAIGQHVILARIPSEAGPASSLRRFKSPAARATASADEPGEVKPEALSAIHAALAAERFPLMLEFVTSRILQVFRLDPDRGLGPRERLVDLGMDSLMALDLKSSLSKGLGLANLPATLAFDTGTPEQLAQALLDLTFPSDGKAQTSNSGQDHAPAPPPMLSEQQVAEMSDEDLEKLLMAKLSAD